MVNEVKHMRPVVMSAIIKFIDLNDLLIGMLPWLLSFRRHRRQGRIAPAQPRSVQTVLKVAHWHQSYSPFPGVVIVNIDGCNMS